MWSVRCCSSMIFARSQDCDTKRMCKVTRLLWKQQGERQCKAINTANMRATWRYWYNDVGVTNENQVYVERLCNLPILTSVVIGKIGCPD